MIILLCPECKSPLYLTKYTEDQIDFLCNQEKTFFSINGLQKDQELHLNEVNVYYEEKKHFLYPIKESSWIQFVLEETSIKRFENNILTEEFPYNEIQQIYIIHKQIGKRHLLFYQCYLSFNDGRKLKFYHLSNYLFRIKPNKEYHAVDILPLLKISKFFLFVKTLHQKTLSFQEDIQFKTGSFYLFWSPFIFIFVLFTPLVFLLSYPFTGPNARRQLFVCSALLIVAIISISILAIVLLKPFKYKPRHYDPNEIPNDFLPKEIDEFIQALEKAKEETPALP